MEYSEIQLRENRKYLELLAKEYPNIQAAATEIINLRAILNLPKGTEHFMSDLHGEYEPFLHIMRNASGAIKRKIDACFGHRLTEKERRFLATLIYYPEEKMALLKASGVVSEDWYRVMIYRLMEVCRVAVSKYTRSKVRKALPADFAYVLDELLHAIDVDGNKEQYYDQIILSIIATERADAFIITVCRFIQRMIIDRLHIIGDIFDRGPGAEIILDHLCSHHSVDVQWGNHDILWMGAASGSDPCIADVITNCVKYNNFNTLEDGYGISTRPLATFAMETYGDDPCASFRPKNPSEAEVSAHDEQLAAQIHKAIAIIEFKLEGQAIMRHPEYGMDDRLLLNKVDFAKGTIQIDGAEYPLNDRNYPTIDPENPYALSEAEAQLMVHLRTSFLHSERLQKHVRFLYKNGGMYLTYNSNLLYHGCIPLEPDGTFSQVQVGRHRLSGKALLDYADQLARQAYFGKEGTREKEDAMDFMWYLWCGPKSPLCGKNRITTFERYFIDDKGTWEERKDPYYSHLESPETAEMILKEFGLTRRRSKIINGHVPVKIRKGESPVKAGGKLLVIDGGLSRAYQPVTGIAGYTLTFNSHELNLSAHEPFESRQKAINEEVDILSHETIVEKMDRRIMIYDTDDGRRIQGQIDDLEMLMSAYRTGFIKQHS